MSERENPSGPPNNGSPYGPSQEQNPQPYGDGQQGAQGYSAPQGGQPYYGGQQQPYSGPQGGQQQSYGGPQGAPQPAYGAPAGGQGYGGPQGERQEGYGGPPSGPPQVAVALAQPQQPARPPARSRRTALLSSLAVLVPLIIILGAYYIWHQGYYFYNTDDAVVSAALAPASPTAPGSITAVYRGVGSTVARGDRIADLRSASGVTISVRAPINGVIVQEGAAVGEVLPAGQPLAQVADLSGATITAYVDEGNIDNVHPGQGVDVTIDAVKDTTFHGTVRQLLPVAASTLSAIQTTDNATGNFTKVTQRIPVQITLQDVQGHTVYPGGSAEVTIHIHD